MRYVSIGALATALHFAIFVALLAPLGPVLATLSGGICGALLSFHANKKFTFLTHNTRRLSALRFYGVTLIYNVLNTTAMYLLTLMMDSEHVIFWLAGQLSISFILSLMSFLIHKYWSYKYV